MKKLLLIALFSIFSIQVNASEFIRGEGLLDGDTITLISSYISSYKDKSRTEYNGGRTKIEFPAQRLHYLSEFADEYNGKPNNKRSIQINSKIFPSCKSLQNAIENNRKIIINKDGCIIN